MPSRKARLLEFGFHTCPLCILQKTEVVLANYSSGFVTFNRYPIFPKSLLFVSYNHFKIFSPSFFEDIYKFECDFPNMLGFCNMQLEPSIPDHFHMQFVDLHKINWNLDLIGNILHLAENAKDLGCASIFLSLRDFNIVKIRFSKKLDEKTHFNFYYSNIFIHLEHEHQLSKYTSGALQMLGLIFTSKIEKIDYLKSILGNNNQS